MQKLSNVYNIITFPHKFELDTRYTTTFSSNKECTSWSCVMMIMHCLYGLKYLITSNKSRFSSGSNALVGSSKIKILDGFTYPLIIFAICRCPPDSFSPENPTFSSSISTFLYKSLIFAYCIISL